MDGALSTVLILGITVLSGIIFFMDMRFIAYALASLIEGFTAVVVILSDKKNTNEKIIMLGLYLIVYLINLVLSLKTKLIAGIEKFKLINKRKSVITLIITVIFCCYSVLKIKDMPVIIYPIVFIFYYVIIRLNYELIVEMIYAYILLWITYLFGKEKTLKNTHIKIKIYKPKYKRSVYMDYFLSEFDNKKISFNSKFQDKLYKNHVSKIPGYVRMETERIEYKVRKTLVVKRVPFINKLIITEMN